MHPGRILPGGASAARPPTAQAEGIFKLCFGDNAPQSLVDFFGSHQPDR